MVKKRKYAGTAPRCKALRKDGEPCKRPATTEDGYCTTHDPEDPDFMSRMASQGGSAPKTATPERPELSIARSRRILAATAELLMKNKITPAVANAVSQTLRVDKTLRESGEFADRLAALEAGKRPAKKKVRRA